MAIRSIGQELGGIAKYWGEHFIIFVIGDQQSWRGDWILWGRSARQ